MNKLSKDQLIQIIGGVVAPDSYCETTCPNGLTYGRNCGPGSTCSTSGSTITCGTETTGTDMCAGTPTCN